MRKIFRKLVTVEEAINILFKHFKPAPLEPEEVDLFNALDRVLAENIVAKMDVPPFDRSIVDGYAVRAEDTFTASETNPVRLKLVDRLRTGDFPKKGINRGETIELDTGSMIPPGANAVIPVEFTEEHGDLVYIYKRVSPGNNIQFAGSDISRGETILRVGYRLTPRDIGVLAALGYSKVKVFRKPRVAIFSIGNELIPPDQPLSSAKIYDVNSYTLYNSVIEASGEPIFLGIAKDDPDSIRDKIEEGLEKADIIVSSGSSSAGYSDMIYRIVNELGAPGVLVHGVKSKPGKPVLIAVINNKPYFGLPGFPTSALIAFRNFVKPIIMMMAGLNPEEALVTVRIKLKRKVRGEKGRRLFNTISIKKEDDLLTGIPLPAISGAITTLANAEGFFEVMENEEYIPPNEIVNVKLFEPILKIPDLIIGGPHSSTLDKKLNQIAERKRNFRIKFLKMNAWTAIKSLLRKEIDIAGINLIDPSTGNYNEHVLREYPSLIKVWEFEREIGLVFRKGNPKRIQSIEDVIERKLIIANREKGSGLREYFDWILKNYAEKRGSDLVGLQRMIPGYYSEFRTDSSAILAVIMGKADYCLAPVEIAKNFDVDWKIIGKEKYWLLSHEKEAKEIEKFFH